MIFEWDEDKAAANVVKHNITFDDAVYVFADEKRIIFLDDRFDYGEERLITVGSVKNRLYIVVYTQTKNTIRIISARKANKREQKKHGNR